MDELVFAYNDLSLFKNKIIYYESSREDALMGARTVLSSVSRCG